MVLELKGTWSASPNGGSLSVYWSTWMFWTWLWPPSKSWHFLSRELGFALPFCLASVSSAVMSWLSLWQCPQPEHPDCDTWPPGSGPGVRSEWPCPGPLPSPISTCQVPMDRVMALSLSRTSLTNMLFCSGVERQHRTERQYRVNSRNLSSSFPWKMAFSVFPSMTNPTSGAAAPEAGGGVAEGRRNPESLPSGFRGPWNCFTSSSAKLRMESQVSYKEQNNQFGVSKQHWKHRLKASLYPLVKELYNSTTIEMTWESLSDFDISLQYFKQHQSKNNLEPHLWPKGRVSLGMRVKIAQ